MWNEYWKIIGFRTVYELNCIEMSLINSAWLSMKKKKTYGSNYNATRHHNLVRNTVVIACLYAFIHESSWWWNVWLMKVFYVAAPLERVALGSGRWQQANCQCVCVCVWRRSIDCGKTKISKATQWALLPPWTRSIQSLIL